MPQETSLPPHQLTSIPVENSSTSDGNKKFEVSGWTVETCKMPILNSKEIKAFNERLTIPLPEICFGNNRLVIKHASSGFHYHWNTLDSLLLVNPTEGEEGENIKVAYADHWSQSRKATDTVAKVINPFDWTYTTTYCGTNDSGSIKFSTPTDPSNHPGIPLAVLSRPDPILFFDEVCLFEDELHDNGMATLQIKVRVMPSCIFVLSRFFLRVDGVVFRLLDVRLYIDIETNKLIREVKAKEMSYDAVKQRLPIEKSHDLTPLTDPNWVAQVFGMLEKDNLIIPSQVSNSEIKTWKQMLGTHLDTIELT